jgi:hypothetical protein
MANGDFQCYKDKIPEQEYNIEYFTAKLPENQLTSNWFHSLLPDQALYSNDGKFALEYQINGNLVYYQVKGQKIFWQTNTDIAASGGVAGKAQLKEDGEFVLIDNSNNIYWRSAISNKNDNKFKGPYRLVNQRDCNLVIYDSMNNIVWSLSSHLPSHKTISVSNCTIDSC